MATKIDSILLPEQDRYLALILTEANSNFGEKATIGDARKVALLLAIPRAERRVLADRVGAESQGGELLNLNRFNREFWITQEESDQTALRMLTTLHPERAEILQALAQGVPSSNILNLYPDEGKYMLREVTQALASHSVHQRAELLAALAPIANVNLNERMQNSGMYTKQLATRSWVRIHMPDVDPDLKGLMVDALGYAFAWHRYRTELYLPDQVNRIHLINIFLDAWESVAKA